MKVNLSIDTSLTIGRYVLEASFWLRDWQFTAETYTSSAIRLLHLGPFCLCITNLKKIKEVYDSTPLPFDDLCDL